MARFLPEKLSVPTAKPLVKLFLTPGWVVTKRPSPTKVITAKLLLLHIRWSETPESTAMITRVSTQRPRQLSLRTLPERLVTGVPKWVWTSFCNGRISQVFPGLIRACLPKSFAKPARWKPASSMKSKKTRSLTSKKPSFLLTKSNKLRHRVPTQLLGLAVTLLSSILAWSTVFCANFLVVIVISLSCLQKLPPLRF